MMRGTVIFIKVLERWAVEVLCGFLKGDAGLLKSRRGGTHDVGKSADATGDHENRQRILDRLERSRERPLLCHDSQMQPRCRGSVWSHAGMICTVETSGMRQMLKGRSACQRAGRRAGRVGER